MRKNKSVAIVCTFVSGNRRDRGREKFPSLHRGKERKRSVDGGGGLITRQSDIALLFLLLSECKPSLNTNDNKCIQSYG